MSAERQFPADFFVVSLDAAVLGDEAAASDKGDFYGLATVASGFLNRVFVDGGEARQVFGGCVEIADELPSGFTHPGG